MQINDVCFGSDIFLITDEIEKEHFFNCDPDSGILKFKSQNISSLTSCCESFLEKIVQHDIFLKQTELQQKSLEEKSDDEFFDALEYEDQEKLESKIEKIDLPFFMEKRDLSKLILDFPEKIKNISFYRMPFGPIQKQIEIQSWHRIEIEKKMMQHFRMSLQNLKSFIPEKNLGPTEYIESTDCFRIHFKMQKFAYNCTCYFDVKLIFNCYFDCFDIVLNNVDSKNIKFITNSLLPTINSLMIVISKEEVYKVIYEIIFALDLCFKKLPLILEQEHKTLLRT